MLNFTGARIVLVQQLRRLVIGLIVITCIPAYANSDVTSPDCSSLGPITLMSGSGIRIEVDGENGGCNATGTRYSYGNVIGGVRVYPGFDAVTGSAAEELLFDQPLEFVKVSNPVRGVLYIGRWVSRRGFVVFMTFEAPRFRSMREIAVNEFLVYEDEEAARSGEGFYQEWGNTWTATGRHTIKGQVLDLGTNPQAGVPGAKISVFNCRAQDGLVTSTLTDANGEFFLREAEDGYFQLRIDPPEGFSLASLRADGLETLYSSGFSQCVDLRPILSDRSRTRTGGLFARDINSVWRFWIPREE